MRRALDPIMSRPSRPWLLPVACTVIGVVWVLWFAYEPERAGEGSLKWAPSPQSTPQSRPGGLSDTDPAGSRPGARGAPVPSSGARTTDDARSSINPPLQLVFQTPTGARVGEAFDLRVAIDARQPITRVVFEIVYDPALLKARTLEEIDYAQRTEGERAFAIDQLSDGRVALVMRLKKGEAVPRNVPLVQFEALSPGRAQIRITDISASDASERSVPWAATGRESEIALN